ncbi:MAG: VRR-NUC domain-containing protein [Muribaculaceae bacterium]|nr:VRR-NUC domain-containing protein [Muribaculaceae bacterium]
MTEKEILEIERSYSESKIQHTCVCWFRLTFPDVAKLLFAVPNGGWRGAKSGAMMVYEGQVKGVADLILLFPCFGKAALCIEMKVPKRKGSSAGRQSEHQQSWQALVERYGSIYVVCHGIIEFVTAVCQYLRTDPQPYIDKVLNNYPLYRGPLYNR